MTTITPFIPPPNSLFQFQPTLDGQTYTGIVSWNLFGQRWYLNLYQPGGALVFSLPLIGSPVGVSIESISWAAGTVTIVTSVPHGYEVGTSLVLSVRNCLPEAYDGAGIEMLVASDTSLTFPLGDDPGPATAFGTVSHDVNIAGGYFESYLVYREANQQFEVSP